MSKINRRQIEESKCENDTKMFIIIIVVIIIMLINMHEKCFARLRRNVKWFFDFLLFLFIVNVPNDKTFTYKSDTKRISYMMKKKKKKKKKKTHQRKFRSF